MVNKSAMTLRVVCLLCVMVYSLTGCDQHGNLDLSKPASLDLTPPPGPPEYQQGWEEGCETGLSTFQTHFHMVMGSHQFSLDPVLVNNKMYFQSWTDAYIYCLIFMYTATQYNI